MYIFTDVNPRARPCYMYHLLTEVPGEADAIPAATQARGAIGMINRNMRILYLTEVPGKGDRNDK